jgi:glyoxylase-like metal-dependent hydrolase (beta-lactamase superfamily II)
MGITEIIPGVFHWTAIHPSIHSEVSSWWLEDGGVLIDPLLPPEEGIEWFAERRQAPTGIVLSNRHHYRSSGELVERFGIPVYCVRQGMHEFGDVRPVTPFEFGDELPGGIVTREIDAICPDETALYLSGHDAIVFADGVVRDGEGLGFVPDHLMDDPEDTKRALIDAFARTLDELQFEHVLLAHGGPVVGDGRAGLRELVNTCRGS